jgi:agmatine/peptidylarginine deiminase
MSQKSITDLNLNSITLSNSNYGNIDPDDFTLEKVSLQVNTTGELLVNNSPVLTQSRSAIISINGINETVQPDTPNVNPIDLFDYGFVCTEDTVCTFTYVANGSAVYTQSIIFNPQDNLLTITFNNDSEVAITITGLFINLYNP